MKAKKHPVIAEIVDRGHRPAIVTFQNGKTKQNREEYIKNDLFVDDEGNSIVAASVDQQVYAGKVQEDPVCNSYMCVLNKDTKQIRLVAVDHVLLKPVFKKRKLLDETLLNKSTNRDLSKTFGSKRSKRATEQGERLQLNVENVKAQLEETVATVKIAEEDLTEVCEESSSYCPAINRNAADLSDVYNVDAIIPSAVLDALEEDAKKYLDDDTIIENLRPIVKLEILNLRNTNYSDKLQRCKIWLYIDILISLLLTQAKNISKHTFQISESPNINQYVLDSFTQMSKQGRMRPRSMKDKTVCYVLVLAMCASGYKINVEALAKELLVGVKRLAELCRILSFTATANKAVYVLKLPLPAQWKKLSPKKKR